MQVMPASSVARAAFAAAILLAAPASADDPAAAKPEWPKTVYYCHRHSNFDEFGGMLDFGMTFTAEGEVVYQFATWSAMLDGNGILGAPKTNPAGIGGPERGTITIQWPQLDPWRKATPEDLSETATIRISNFALFPEKMRKQEHWHQTIVARGSEVLTGETKGDSILYLSPLEPALVTDYDGQFGAPFSISLANLLGWGSGLETLTVYDVFAGARKYKPDVLPNGPVGTLRIVGKYQLNMPALARAFAGIRAQHDAWRTGLTDFKAACDEQRMDDPAQDIVVT